VLTFAPFKYLSPDILSLPEFLNVKQLSKVVFPAPLAPMMARNSPGRTTPVTSQFNDNVCEYADNRFIDF
jgi:hypothetical protein